MAKQRFSKDYGQAVTKFDQQHSGGTRDPRFFKPQPDKNGRGTITLRFLPSKDTDTDFIKADLHEFSTRSGSYFKDNCPKNIGKECPICDYAWGNWKKGDKEHNKPFEKFTPKQKYIMNIIVLKDKENPDNEGKVFLWHFGNQIMKKIREQIAAGVYPWDWEKGLDFKLKIETKQFEGKAVPNYDSSYFVEDEDPSPLDADVGDEDLFALSEFLDAKNYKSFDDLKDSFEKRSGVDASKIGNGSLKSRDDDDDDDKPRQRASSLKKETREEAPVVEDDLPFDQPADEDGFVIDDAGEENPEDFFSGITQ